MKAAFAGESQARNSYTFFAEIAKKEGYEQIAAIFEKTADNERAHAQMWGEELGLIGDTGKNLDDITGEYAAPAGYLVNEKEAEAFDREFPYMEKEKLPGQIFE